MASTIKTCIFSIPVGFGIAHYLGAAPALGIAASALTERYFSNLTKNNEKEDKEEKIKAVDNTLADLAGVATVLAINNSSIPYLSRAEKPLVMDCLLQIGALWASFKITQKSIQLISPTKIFLQIAKHPAVDYIVRIAIATLATKIINDRLGDDAISLHISTAFTGATLIGFAVNDLIYPILIKPFTSPNKQTT